MDVSYSFDTSDNTVQDGLRRIACDQLDRALSAMRDPADIHESVHDARKRCKKLRGLIRLVRPAFPDYKAENAALRDASRRLSDFRDRTAVIETYDRLTDTYGARLDPDIVAPMREELLRRRQRAAEAEDLGQQLDAFRTALADARDRAAGWKLKKDGFDAVEGGLRKTLHRAHDTMKTARDSRNAHDLHDWRKRVKYHWYHARLLKKIWPGQMDPYVDAADDLSDTLGNHHDLAEFLIHLQDATLPAAARHALHDPVKAEMKRLEQHAFTLGAWRFAEKPKRLAQRWGAWWSIWRADAE